ncbi:MAG: glycosyltransferase, partial [Candidatus Eisenbacteria bacterium]
PTVTGVDPDGVIATHGMGEIADTLDGFVDAVGRLSADPSMRRVMGRRARVYVETHHAADAIHRRLGEMIEPLVARSRSRR